MNFFVIPSLWPVLCCSFTPALYWNGMDTSTRYHSHQRAKQQIEVVSLTLSAVSCDSLGETQGNCARVIAV